MIGPRGTGAGRPSDGLELAGTLEAGRGEVARFLEVADEVVASTCLGEHGPGQASDSGHQDSSEFDVDVDGTAGVTRLRPGRWPGSTAPSQVYLLV